MDKIKFNKFKANVKKIRKKKKIELGSVVFDGFKQMIIDQTLEYAVKKGFLNRVKLTILKLIARYSGKFR